MSDEKIAEPPVIAEALTQIQATTLALAETHRHDCEALMALLRQLESLHQHVREDFFVPLLPENRHDLYDLLRDIEENGGWPYIERMRLRDLLVNVFAAELPGDRPDA
ncbi:MAG: hypothetical protein HC838_12740 [Spirulinaceae cyanobacterium RM2_2_10]|nr:hypothetical protein [Spirulinaceae cyanobacterium SM2_1_0]NJO20725.1 hypothetical protein [Spirulinaceae cyanobacterium RM2_2_10]